MKRVIIVATLFAITFASTSTAQSAYPENNSLSPVLLMVSMDIPQHLTIERILDSHKEASFDSNAKRLGKKFNDEKQESCTKAFLVYIKGNGTSEISAKAEVLKKSNFRLATTKELLWFAANCADRIDTDRTIFSLDDRNRSPNGERPAVASSADSLLQLKIVALPSEGFWTLAVKP